jgi:ADP-heptose:LPS heptosyltransferase
MVRLLERLFPSCRVEASVRKASPFRSARTLGGRGRFEVGVTLRNAARAKILVRLASRWCTGSRGEGAILLLSESKAVDRSCHQVYDADPILAALGVEKVDSAWRATLPDGLREEGRATLERAGVDCHRSIGLAPATARGTDKRWPVERYGELASCLCDEGFEPVVVIGPGEANIAREVEAAAGCELPTVGTDCDVAGLAALVAAFKLLVGNDSGPVQTAAFFGTPVVAIFGPTDPHRTAPQGAGHQVLRGSLDFSDPGRSVSVDDSLAAVLDSLHRGCRPGP